MQLRLKEIADIRVGSTLRGKDASLKIDEAGLPLLRISDLSQSGQIQIQNPHLVSRESVKPQFRVQPDDILVANRGVRMTAAIVPPELNAYIGGQLFYLRLKSDKLTPRYLHWFLNLASTQQFLRSLTKGSYVKNLSIANFKELPIPLPSLDVQQQIVQMAELARREQALVQKISEKRAIYSEAALQKLATGRITF